MKRKIFIISALLTLTVFGFIACQKKDAIRQTETNPNGINNNKIGQSEFVQVNPRKNLKNPFEEVGIKHNSGLSFIFDNHDISEVVSISSTFDLLDEWLIQENIDQETFERFLRNSESLGIKPLDSDAETLQENVFELIDIHFPNINIEVKNRLNELFNLIDTNLDDEINTASIGTYNEISSKVLNIEREVLKNNELTEEERLMILGAYSVARYSLAFVLEKGLNQPPQGILDENNEIIEGAAWPPNWGAIGKVDLAAALTGFLGGLAGGETIGSSIEIGVTSGLVASAVAFVCDIIPFCNL